MNNKVNIIEEAVNELLLDNKTEAIKIINQNYGFSNIDNVKRNYSDNDKC